MTSANSLNLPHKILFALLTAALMLTYADNAFAQSGYTPPPMFEDMGSNSARPNADSGYIVEPKASIPKPEAAPPVPGTQRPPVILPRVSVDPDKNPRPPVTPYIPSPPKQMAPIVEPVKKPRVVSKPSIKDEIGGPKPIVAPPSPKKPLLPIPKSVVEPLMPEPVSPDMTTPIYKGEPVYSPVVKGTKPQENLTKPPASTKPPSDAMPAAKVTSKGVVTGPKTMPAVPTGNVDQIETFDDSAIENEPTIMERNLQARKKAEQKESATLTPIIPPKPPRAENKSIEDVPMPDIAEGKPPAINFDNADKPDILKKILPYQPGQIELSKEDMDAISAGVLAELKAKPDWRVQILSHATPQGDSLSSDRRISLSRALAMRSGLVAGGVDASLIDLRAEGLQSASADTGDRVDLFLYNPATP